MNEQTDSFHLTKPQWRRPDSGWWFTIWGGIAAIITLLHPSISTSAWYIRLSIGLVGFVVAPFMISIIFHLYKLVWFIWKRNLNYDNLYNDWFVSKQQMSKATETIRLLGEALERKKKVEISRVNFFRNKLYIIVKRKRGLSIEEGQEIHVIDSSDGFLLGYFRVSAIRTNEYIAVENGHIDPVWRGYANTTGESEMQPPPGSIGFLI